MAYQSRSPDLIGSIWCALAWLLWLALLRRAWWAVELGQGISAIIAVFPSWCLMQSMAGVDCVLAMRCGAELPWREVRRQLNVEDIFSNKLDKARFLLLLDLSSCYRGGRRREVEKLGWWRQMLLLWLLPGMDFCGSACWFRPATRPTAWIGACLPSMCYLAGLLDPGTRAGWMMRRFQRGFLLQRSKPATQLLLLFVFFSGDPSVKMQAVAECSVQRRSTVGYELQKRKGVAVGAQRTGSETARRWRRRPSRGWWWSAAASAAPSSPRPWSTTPTSSSSIPTGHVLTSPGSRTERLTEFQRENGKIKSSKSVLIIGGGPTGVELAGEIAVDYPDKKVTLVHRGSRLLEFIDQKASKKCLDWLTSKKVHVLFQQSVDLGSLSNTEKLYKTSSGETITADCHFLCIGKPLSSSWLHDTILKESLDNKGRLMVEKDLRVKGYTNIFAIGDITDIPEIKQGYLAQKHALLVAKNLKLLIKGSPASKLATYCTGYPLAIVSLGRKEGLAQLPFVTLTGRIPGMLKSGDLFVGKTRKQMGLDA